MRHKLNWLVTLFLAAALAGTLPSAEAAGHRSTHASHAKKKRSHRSKRPTARQDRDGDGIPNRHDRDIDGDGIPNRRDRDIDGDGL